MTGPDRRKPTRLETGLRSRLAGLLLSLGCAAAAGAAQVDWPFYGGDPGGTRFSAAAQINTATVGGLRREWVYRTGDKARRDAALMKRINFEATPVLVGDKLIVCTPFNEIIALDPVSGEELWRFDPRVATDRRPANRYNCRGAARRSGAIRRRMAARRVPRAFSAVRSMPG